MSTTNENLKEAFAGESQANQKYLAFAKEAEKAGSLILQSCSVQLLRRNRFMLKVISRHLEE